MINLIEIANGIDTTSVEMDAVWKIAETLAKDTREPIYIPPGSYLLSSTLRADKLVGVPNETFIHLSENFAFGGSENFFAIENYGYTSKGLVPKVECSINYFGISIESKFAYSQLCAIMGVAGVTSGVIDRCSFIARLTDPNNPPQIDSLLSFVAACKDVVVTRTYFSNRTGWHGSTVNEHRGGIDVGIRNGIQANRDLDQNATERIEIVDCDFLHCTSDESIATWGGQGHTRKNKIHHNRFVSDTISGNANGEALHDVLLSIYPGDVGGGIGDSAQVYENEIFANSIVDKAGSRYCIRVGYGIATDLDNKCYDNKVYGNDIQITVPTGFEIGAVIGQNRNLFPPDYTKPNNQVYNNKIEVVGDKIKPYGIYNFDDIYGNACIGNIIKQNHICNFAKICDAHVENVGGVNVVSPIGFAIDEMLLKFYGVYIKNDSNGVLSYFAGNDVLV